MPQIYRVPAVRRKARRHTRLGPRSRGAQTAPKQSFTATVRTAPAGRPSGVCAGVTGVLRDREGLATIGVEPEATRHASRTADRTRRKGKEVDLGDHGLP